MKIWTRATAWLKGCHGKHRHRSKGAAEAQARSLLKRGDPDVDAYYCLVCHGWHVGHRLERREQPAER